MEPPTGEHPSGKGLVAGNGAVVSRERFQNISEASKVAAILFTFCIDWYLVYTGTRSCTQGTGSVGLDLKKNCVLWVQNEIMELLKARFCCSRF